MRKVTKRYTVYNYEELSEEAKTDALNELRYINVDYEWWQDDSLLELSAKELKDCKIKMSKKWYEISPDKNIPGEYPAYTGLFKWKNLYFSIEREWYIQFIDLEVTDENIFRKFLKIPKKLWQNCYWYFNEQPYREVNTKLVIESDKPDGKDFTEKENEIIDKAIERMNNKIEEALKSLEENYDYLISDESIIETIKLNEYEFTKEGHLA